jgi:hypothetical protein
MKLLAGKTLDDRAGASFATVREAAEAHVGPTSCLMFSLLAAWRYEGVIAEKCAQVKARRLLRRSASIANASSGKGVHACHRQ